MEKKIRCIYRIYSDAHSKEYIGSTESYHKRIREHFLRLKKGARHAIKLQLYFNKYGRDSLKHAIVEVVDAGKDLFEIEQFYLDFRKPFFNSDPNAGSSRGRVVKEETKQLLSKIFTGRAMSEEWKQKISEANKGKKKTPEHIAAILKSKKGKFYPRTEEGQKSYMLKRGSMRPSDDGIRRIAASKIGVPRPRWIIEKLAESKRGSKLTQEHKEILRKTASRPENIARLREISPNKNGKGFPHTEATKKLLSCLAKERHRLHKLQNAS